MPTKQRPEFEYLPYEFWREMPAEQFELFAGRLMEILYPNFDINQTIANGDGGKDFVLLNANSGHYLKTIQDNSIPFEEEVVNELASLITDTGQLIFGEAKRTKHFRATTFANNVLSALKNTNCKKLVIVTSSTVNMAVYAKLHEILHGSGIDLQVIHAASITNLLSKRRELIEKYDLEYYPKIMTGKDINLETIMGQVFDEIVCYFVFKISSPNFKHKELRDIAQGTVVLKEGELLLLHLLVENQSNKEKEISIALQQYAHWLPIKSESNRHYLLPAMGSRFFSYQMQLNSTSEVRLPHVKLIEIGGEEQRNNSTEIIVDVGECTAEPYFLLPYRGKNAKSKLNVLSRALGLFQRHEFNTMTLIQGPAGTGKSRLIDESIQGLAGVTPFSATIDQGNSLLLLVGILKKFLKSHIKPSYQQTIVEQLKNESLINAEKLAEFFVSPLVEPVLVILEDLHHADTHIIKWLKKLIELHQDDQRSKLFVILTSRNDHTFPNPAFDGIAAKLEDMAANTLPPQDALLDAPVQSIQPVYDLKLTAMDDEDALTLITAIFDDDVSEVIIKKIHALSENRPFNIIQITEYLAEQSIAELKHRSSYTITNQSSFIANDTLPESIKELFRLRINGLRDNVQTQNQLTLLTALSLYSIRFKQELISQISSTLGIEGDLSLLVQRGYLKSYNNEVLFAHENIMHFLLDKNINDPLYLNQAAEKLADSPILMTALVERRQCQIHFHADNNDRVLAIVENELGNRDVDSISEKNQLKDSLAILQFGEETIKKVARLKEDMSPIGKDNGKLNNQQARDLFDILFLKSYINKFTQNYTKTVTSIEKSLEHIKLLIRHNPHLKQISNDIKIAKLRQMAGHAAQNCGVIHRSNHFIEQVIDELEDFDEFATSTDVLELAYDAHDRIRKNYMYMGNLSRAQRSLKRAKKAAEQKSSKFLTVITGLSDAELYFIRDPQKAFSIWNANPANMKNGADKRVALAYDLIELQRDILQRNDNDNIYQRLRVVNDKAQEQGVIGPLPKVHLLSGLKLLMDGQYEQSIKAFRKANDIAVTNDYGIFQWISNNNWALALWKQNKKIQAHKQFMAALQQAQQQGFLDFLKNTDALFFQHALVVNCLNFSRVAKMSIFEEHILTITGFTNTSQALEQLEPAADNIFRFDQNSYFMTFI